MANTSVITSDVGIRIFHNRDRRENITAFSLDKYPSLHREDILFRTYSGGGVGRGLPRFPRSWSGQPVSARSLSRERHAFGTNRLERQAYLTRQSYWRHRNKGTSAPQSRRSWWGECYRRRGPH